MVINFSFYRIIKRNICSKLDYWDSEITSRYVVNGAYIYIFN